MSSPITSVPISLSSRRTYLEATTKSKTKQSDIDRLAGEVDRRWWAKNKRRFTKAKLS